MRRPSRDDFRCNRSDGGRGRGAGSAAWRGVPVPGGRADWADSNSSGAGAARKTDPAGASLGHVGFRERTGDRHLHGAASELSDRRSFRRHRRTWPRRCGALDDGNAAGGDARPRRPDHDHHLRTAAADAGGPIDVGGHRLCFAADGVCPADLGHSDVDRVRPCRVNQGGPADFRVPRRSDDLEHSADVRNPADRLSVLRHSGGRGFNRVADDNDSDRRNHRNPRPGQPRVHRTGDRQRSDGNVRRDGGLRDDRPEPDQREFGRPPSTFGRGRRSLFAHVCDVSLAVDRADPNGGAGGRNVLCFDWNI